MLIIRGITDENELRNFEHFVTDLRGRNDSAVYFIPFDRGNFLDENGRAVTLDEEPQSGYR